MACTAWRRDAPLSIACSASNALVVRLRVTSKLRGLLRLTRWRVAAWAPPPAGPLTSRDEIIAPQRPTCIVPAGHLKPSLRLARRR